MGWGPGWGAGKFSRLNCASPSELERISAPRPGNGKARQARKKKKQAWLAPVAASGNSRVRPLSPNFPSFVLFISLSLFHVCAPQDGLGVGRWERFD